MEMALENPSAYVLKPEREGCGKLLSLLLILKNMYFSLPVVLILVF